MLHCVDTELGASNVLVMRSKGDMPGNKAAANFRNKAMFPEVEPVPKFERTCLRISIAAIDRIFCGSLSSSSSSKSGTPHNSSTSIILVVPHTALDSNSEFSNAKLSIQDDLSAVPLVGFHNRPLRDSGDFFLAFVLILLVDRR